MNGFVRDARHQRTFQKYKDNSSEVEREKIIGRLQNSIQESDRHTSDIEADALSIFELSFSDIH